MLHAVPCDFLPTHPNNTPSTHTQETTEKLLSLRIADEAKIKELQQEKTCLQERLVVLQAETAAQLESQRQELDSLKAKVCIAYQYGSAYNY